MALLPATHFICLVIRDSFGALRGTAQVDVNWPDGVPVKNMDDARILGEKFTEDGHKRGLIPLNCHYVILSWSEYGRG
jgi:hypothetical protein